MPCQCHLWQVVLWSFILPYFIIWTKQVASVTVGVYENMTLFHSSICFCVSIKYLLCPFWNVSSFIFFSPRTQLSGVIIKFEFLGFFHYYRIVPNLYTILNLFSCIWLDNFYFRNKNILKNEKVSCFQY
jgi:hypothetical protein